MPEVKTIVREHVVTAGPRDPLPDVARLMDRENVGSVVIVEEDRPVGIVTDRDVAMEVVARGEDPTLHSAVDVMTADPVTVDVGTGIFDVLRTMADENVRRVPAVNEDGTLAGIVTFDDFVILLGRELKLLGDIVESEIPPYDHL